MSDDGYVTASGPTYRVTYAASGDAQNDIELLLAELARLRAELAAIKARRCETCKHFGYYYCLLHKIEIDKTDYCSRWQDKEAADG